MLIATGTFGPGWRGKRNVYPLPVRSRVASLFSSSERRQGLALFTVPAGAMVATTLRKHDVGLPELGTRPCNHRSVMAFSGPFWHAPEANGGMFVRKAQRRPSFRQAAFSVRLTGTVAAGSRTVAAEAGTNRLKGSGSRLPASVQNMDKTALNVKGFFSRAESRPGFLPGNDPVVDPESRTASRFQAGNKKQTATTDADR